MKTYNNDLMMKVVWYYYIENITQQEISKRLGISRMRIVKMLEDARNEGIIQFRVAHDQKNYLVEEEKLVQKYDLQDAYVVPTPEDFSQLNEMLAQAGAAYVSDRIGEDAFINMGYGDTMSHLLNHLAAATRKTVNIVSLTGGVNYYLPNAQSHTFSARLFLYPAPLLVSSKETAQAIRQEPAVQEIDRMVRLASLSVVGIGGMDDEATIIKNQIFRKSDFTLLRMQGAVADIMTHFLNRDGQPIFPETEERMIATSLDVLRDLKNVIAVAGGSGKVEAIKAVLHSRLINVLITDQDTADALLQE